MSCQLSSGRISTQPGSLSAPALRRRRAGFLLLCDGCLRRVPGRVDCILTDLKATDSYARPADVAEAAALATAQQRAAQAEERLSELKAVLEDMHSDRDAWRDQAQRLALPSPQSSRSWWRWLRSTG
jgi:hypothetical protein